MNAQWNHTLSQTILWLVAEIVLNLVGLDNLANYSEFVFNRKIMLHSQELVIVVESVNECVQAVYGQSSPALRG